MAQEETIWYGKKKECGEIFLQRMKRRKIKELVKEGENGEIKGGKRLIIGGEEENRKGKGGRYLV